MPFRHTSRQIAQIVAAAKVAREGQRMGFISYRAESLSLALELDLLDGPLINLRFIVTAGRPDVPATFRAALLLEDQRIRGIDHHDVGRKRFYRVVIPAGWHQNILDPNLISDDSNRHEALPDFAPTDLADFLHKCAALWHIDLGTESTLL